MSESLNAQKCEPCHDASVTPVGETERTELMNEIPEWSTKDRDGIPMLERIYKLKNYKRAVAFTNQVADLAEEQGHHPEIILEWGKVTVTWWTHTINGLHQNDFICAAKTDALYETAISG